MSGLSLIRLVRSVFRSHPPVIAAHPEDVRRLEARLSDMEHRLASLSPAHGCGACCLDAPCRSQGVRR